jgi:hypothetical protein
MLRITTSADAASRRWTLWGQLAGLWVAELREEWMRLRCESRDGQLLVDLSDVTFIDEAGEELLREMRDRGVEFVAKGVETRHILENLATREKPQLRRFLGPSKYGGCS